jgi:hypothetical protein
MVRTILALPAGKKVSVPRLLKRTIQIVLAVALTSAVLLVMIVGNGMLVGRGASLQGGYSAWLAFIKRPDILTTMCITAAVAIGLVYWMRAREK